MIVSKVEEIADIMSLVGLECTRVIYDPFEIHMSFDDSYLTISCALSVTSGKSVWKYDPNMGNYYNNEVPVYKLVRCTISNLEFSNGSVIISFREGALGLAITPTEIGQEAIAFVSKQGASSILVPGKKE